MKRTLNFWKWQRTLRKVDCITGLVLLTLIAAGYKIIKIKAREAIFYEFNFLVKRYLPATNHPARMEKISVNDCDYEHIYKIWLTHRIDLYTREDLVVDMNFLKDNIAMNLNKRIHIYCNGEWVC